MGVGKKAVLGGRDVVKVAIVQKAPRFLDKEASLTRAEGYIAEAAAGGSELIVFPEVWLAGYPYWTEGGIPRCSHGSGDALRFAMPQYSLRAKTPSVSARQRGVPTPTLLWAATRSTRGRK
jgi:hypothetical protein